MFRDLRQMVPGHIEFEILDDGWTLTNGLLRGGRTFERRADWPPLCEFAETVVSDLQDFMADTKSVWWPMVGHKRLGYRVECIDGRPELVLFL